MLIAAIFSRTTTWSQPSSPSTDERGSRLLSVTGVRDWLKPAWGEEGLLHLTLHRPALREPKQELRTGSWRQEQKQGPERSTVYWLPPHDILGLISSTT